MQGSFSILLRSNGELRFDFVPLFLINKFDGWITKRLVSGGNDQISSLLFLFTPLSISFSFLSIHLVDVFITNMSDEIVRWENSLWRLHGSIFFICQRDIFSTHAFEDRSIETDRQINRMYLFASKDENRMIDSSEHISFGEVRTRREIPYRVQIISLDQQWSRSPHYRSLFLLDERFSNQLTRPISLFSAFACALCRLDALSLSSAFFLSLLFSFSRSFYIFLWFSSRANGTWLCQRPASSSIFTAIITHTRTAAFLAICQTNLFFDHHESVSLWSKNVWL